MKKIVLILLCGFIYVQANLSTGTFKKLQNAQKLIEQNKYKEALALLNPILKSESKIAKSYALQTMASIHLEKVENKKAAKSYEQILQLKAFKQKDLDRITFVLSQIYLSELDYKKGLKYALALKNAKGIQKERLYENISLGYYYTQQYQKSIKYVNQVIQFKTTQLETYNQLSKEEKKKKTKPNLEPWYKILYSSYFELKQYSAAIKTIQYLITNFESKEEYWMQLVLIYQNQKRTKKMLSTLELAYDKSLINKKRNIDFFISLLLQQELFNKAALLIEQSLHRKILKNNKKNFGLLITSHVNAKNTDKAIAVLTKSEFAKNELYQIMLGNLYYNEGHYNKVITSMKNDYFKKNSKYDGQRNLLLALSYFELDNEKMTKEYLKRARANKHERKRANNIIKQMGYKI